MTQYFRKVRCSERLPDKQGMYMTNNGVHHFNIRKNEWAIISQTYIVWWFEPIEEQLYTESGMSACWDAALSHALKLKGYYKTFSGFIRSLKSKI